MAIDVTIETTIARSRHDVARYVMDRRNDVAWICGISESELLGEGVFGEGSEVRRVAHFMGKRIDYVLRVERLDPDSFLGMRSVKAPFPMTVDYAFADADGGTRMSIRVGGQPGRLYRLAGPVLARQTRASIASDLARLRALLEYGADAAPAGS